MPTLSSTLGNINYQILAVEDHEVTLSGIAAIVRADGRCTLAAAVGTVDQASTFNHRLSGTPRWIW